MAPFDLAAFFRMPPASEDAAPLYLEAFAEFSAIMEDCLPPARRGKTAAAGRSGVADRELVAAAIQGTGTGSVDPGRLDATLARYAEGFRKLDLAQARPRCVFATGCSYDSLLPHAQAAREVVRFLVARGQRAINRGDLDSAIGDVGRILRLARDLRPRAHSIVQLVSTAIEGHLSHALLTPLLAHPNLKPGQCDRLITMLRQHEAESTEPFATGIKMEYLSLRGIVRVFERGVRVTVDADGRAVETRLDRAGVLRYFAELLDQTGKASSILGPSTTPARDDPQVLKKLSDYLTTHPFDFARERRGIDDYFRGLLALPTTAPAPRFHKLEEWKGIYLTPGSPKSSFFLTLPLIDQPTFVQSYARGEARIRAFEGLIALRRWQLTRKAPATDFAAACRAAGLASIPMDPFSGGPLKLASVNGDPVVYSIGDDGVDDLAGVDSELGTKPKGDYLFRLPRPRSPSGSRPLRR